MTLQYFPPAVITRLFAAFLFLGLAFSDAGAQEVVDTRDPEIRAADSLRNLWRSSGAPSISLAIVKDGRLVFSESVGYADLGSRAKATPETVYNIGSVSKIMTAVAVMQLVEDGRVRLDNSIRDYVPDYPEKRDPVTVRHVMTHTAGIRHYLNDEQLTPFGPYETFLDALDIFRDDTLRFTPGDYYLYSSFGINLLQGVVEHVSGLEFETYMRRNVWEPAGMLRTSFDVPGRIVMDRARGYQLDDGELTLHPYEDVTYKYASGGMMSSVNDLIRFGLAVRSGRLLEPQTVDQMFSPQFDTLMRFAENGNHREITRWRQALVWRVRWDDAGREFVYHCGTVKGFNACLLIYLDEDLILAIANNRQAIGFGPAVDIADIFRVEEDAD